MIMPHLSPCCCQAYIKIFGSDVLPAPKSVLEVSVCVYVCVYVCVCVCLCEFVNVVWWVGVC